MIKGINRALEILLRRSDELNNEYLKADDIKIQTKLDIQIKEVWCIINILENEIAI